MASREEDPGTPQKAMVSFWEAGDAGHLALFLSTKNHNVNCCHFMACREKLMSCLASFSFPPNLYSTQWPECPDQNTALILPPSCCPEDGVPFPQRALCWLPPLTFKQHTPPIDISRLFSYRILLSYFPDPKPKHLSLTSLASPFPDWILQAFGSFHISKILFMPFLVPRMLFPFFLLCQTSTLPLRACSNDTSSKKLFLIAPRSLGLCFRSPQHTVDTSLAVLRLIRGAGLTSP